MSEEILAWNELSPIQQAVLWTMARYETEISNGRNPYRVYTVTKLYHLSKKFYSIREEEFCKVLYALAEGTDLVDVQGNEIALRVPREAVLQQNTGEPYMLLEKLTDAITRIQDWSSADMATLSVEELANIWNYLDEHSNLGVDFCYLPPTRDYAGKLENLLGSVRRLSCELPCKIIEDGRLPAE